MPKRVISAVTLAEITVGPMGSGAADGNALRLFMEGLRDKVLPLDADRARQAASIRAPTGLK